MWKNQEKAEKRKYKEKGYNKKSLDENISNDKT